jgi:galactose-1-phosphate uridylyltransferase
MNTQALDETLRQLLETENLDNASPGALTRSVASDASIATFRPEASAQIDPRNGERILYSKARARRPHDPSRKSHHTPTSTLPAHDPNCPICQGKTTGLLDITPLSRGVTFINKNLFPVVFPSRRATPPPEVRPDPKRVRTRGYPASGAHYLQWVSSRHDRDLHSSPLGDLTIMLSRLAHFEKCLVSDPQAPFPRIDLPDREPVRGHVGIIKNFGRSVGGSLVHGHQQIVHTNVLPRRLEDDARFLERTGISYAAHLLEDNPESLTIKEYGKIKLITPYCLRRPLEALILPTRPERRYLHDFTKTEISQLARALRDATQTVVNLLGQLHREPAYNLVFHSGVSGTFYVEILPHTQEMGGYEQMGLYLCQGTARTSTEDYRQTLSDR